MIKKGRASILRWYALIALLGIFQNVGAQGFGNDVNQTPLNDSLLKFSIYGKEYVYVGYNASTATGGMVGGDTVRVWQTGEVRGDVYAYAKIDTGLSASEIGGLNLGTGYADAQKFQGKVYAGAQGINLHNSSHFYQPVYVQGLVKMDGPGGPNRIDSNFTVGALTIQSNNQFYSNIRVTDSKITASGSNKYGINQLTVTGNITANNVAAQIYLNEAFAFPDKHAPISYNIPTLTVEPANTTCSHSTQGWWSMSMCPSFPTSIPAQTTPQGSATLVDILPPGKYGDLTLGFASKIMLGEGMYEFNSITMSGAKSEIIVDQPNRGRTQIMVKGNFKTAFQSMIMPKDTTGLKGGTILVYQGGTANFDIGQENVIFATIVTPNAMTLMGYGSKLYGQIWAKSIALMQNFVADDGLYIPFSPANPAVSVDAAHLYQDEGNTGSLPFPILFKLNYMNGRDVKIYFHTADATATATDYQGTVKDSVVIKAGSTSIEYSLVSVFGDKDSEPNEYFNVVIDSVVNAEMVQASTPLTIVNDDGDLKDTTVTVMENTTPIMTVPFVNTTTYTLHFLLVGGADMALFTLDEATGALTFKTAPDYEHPTDADNNSIYDVKLAVCFQSACTDQGLQMTVHVNLADVVEPSVVVITAAETNDSTWTHPDTVYIHSDQVNVYWTKDGENASEWSTVAMGEVTLIIKTWKGVQSDTPGSDTLVVISNDKKPVLEFKVTGKLQDTIPVNRVVETKNPADTLYYTNTPQNGIQVNVTFIGKNLQPYDTLITLNPTLAEGINNVCYTATDAFGNSTTNCIGVVLDTKPPVVIITSPQDLLTTLKAVETITWTVDGVNMETLRLQSLALGTNVVVRSYQDLAGNVGSDTVLIHLTEQDDIYLDIEKDLVSTNTESIQEYYKDSPLRTGELFTLSIQNQSTGLEDEALYGKASTFTSAVDKDGKVVSKTNTTHLGPTLVIKLTLPLMGGVDAAGNDRAGAMRVLQDENGLIAVTAGAGTNRVLVPMDQYVSDHCLADAFKDVPADSLLSASLFRNSVSLAFMIYDATGHFVDQLKLAHNITNPDYLDDNGQVTLYLELKPTLNGLASSRGRLLGTGVYIVKGTVTSKSVRLCDMPNGKKAEVLDNSNELLKKFGYQRQE